MNKDKQKYCLGFVFDKNLERVLLIKKILKSDIPIELANNLNNKLNGIGGKNKVGESPIDAMIRECREETVMEIETKDWIYFCLLDAEFGYVYCFYTIVDNFIKFINGKPELIYKQMEDEHLDIYFVNDGHGDYRDFPHMANLEYLIPMALNHYQNLDTCKNFTVIENNE